VAVGSLTLAAGDDNARSATICEQQHLPVVAAMIARLVVSEQLGDVEAQFILVGGRWSEVVVGACGHSLLVAATSKGLTRLSESMCS